MTLKVPEDQFDQGDDHTIVIEGPETVVEKINYSVSNGILKVSLIDLSGNGTE